MIAVVLALTSTFAAFGAWAGSESSDMPGQDSLQDPRTQTLQKAFDLLHSVGNAANSGTADEEALRQACALFRDHGSLALQDVMDAHFRDDLLGSESSVGSRVSARGYSALSGAMGNALGRACSSLTGQDGGLAGRFDPEQIREMAFAMAFDEGLGVLKNSGLPFTARLEISGSLMGGGGSNWEVLTVQPLWQDADGQHHILTQLSWNHTEGRKGYVEGDTLNAGLAYRWLNDERTAVYGVNSFIDHARELNHNRMSVGADVQTSQLGASINRYFPLSDWKSVDDYKEERPSDGWDVGLQGRVPELPSWQLNLKGYQWSSNELMERENTYGYQASLQWQPFNALIWEAGIRDEQQASPQFLTQMRLVYKFGEPIEKMWDRPLALADVSERVYDKVQRENAMRVTQRIKDSAYVTVTQTIGANTAILGGSTVTLFAGRQLPRPFTVRVSAAGGSTARLVFRDGAVLTVGAGSVVRVEARLVTLVAGVFQYISGSTNVVINVPGGTVTLLGTDVDVSTDGTTSVLRVRDGRAVLAGTASGSATLNPGEAAGSVSGVVGAALAPNDPVYLGHTDEISEKIDRAAAPQNGPKVAPYPTQEPRLTTVNTVPGNPIAIALKFNIPVTVTGAPQLVLNIGGNTRQAVYSGGTDTDDLSFTYTLLPGDAGATGVTVQSLDLNGGTIIGNGKNAVITIADVLLDLMGSVSDVTAPSGYAVAFTTDPVTAANVAAAAFQITGAEVGTTYNYTISSSNGGTNVTGNGAIATATQNITGIDVSGLNDGTLTVSLTLTDAEANTGAAATDTVVKDIIALLLDFVDGTYALNGTSYGSLSALPGWSFTRASPATTYAENADGSLTAFAANTPRITDKGLLIEGSRTNTLTWSQDLSNAAWQTCGGIGLKSSDVASAPDGTMTADKVYGGNGAAEQNRCRPGARLFAFTFSIYVKSAEYTRFMVADNSAGGGALAFKAIYDLSSGTVLASNNATASIQSLGNGWYRCVAYVPNGSANYIKIMGVPDSMNTSVTSPSFTGDGTSGVYVWGGQVEQATFASSYIPTTTASVTRSADSADVTGLTNFDRGSIYAEGLFPNRPAPGYTQTLVSAGPGTDNGWLARIGQNAGGNFITNAQDNTNTTVAAINGGAVSLNTVYKSASRISPNDFALSVNGGAVATDTAGNTRTVNLIQVGKAGSAYPLDGYLREIRLYPGTKTNAQLQALASP